MRILGIDPGLATTGYGLIERMNKARNEVRCLTYGVMTTAQEIPLPARLAQLGQNFRSLIKKTKPDAIAIEKLYFSANRSSALAVAHARGVLLASAHEAKIPIYELQPLEIKKILTLFGRASKSQVQHVVARLLKLEVVPKPDDAADALACALCAAYFIGDNPHL